ncbi:hypothetical protein [Smaragdicoccus niigatensis]|uniref:hypothetical protein n=1 Tax=Smaragdicoccus niigatensis TaxID=359359 RepID=UPI00039CE760|nr:hypothetical protein [Smaragdicoccus niigatensis]
MNTLRTAIPTWARIALGITAIPHLATGFWAVLAPANWYANYPGFGEPLVAAEPPFNAHLASDAGVGFLAVGVLLLLAAIIGDRLLTFVAAATLFVFSAPHLVFHLMHRVPTMSTTGFLTGIVGLVVAIILPVVLVLTIKVTEGD